MSEIDGLFSDTHPLVKKSLMAVYRELPDEREWVVEQAQKANNPKAYDLGAALMYLPTTFLRKDMRKIVEAELGVREGDLNAVYRVIEATWLDQQQNDRPAEE